MDHEKTICGNDTFYGGQETVFCAIRILFTEHNLFNIMNYFEKYDIFSIWKNHTMEQIKLFEAHKHKFEAFWKMRKNSGTWKKIIVELERTFKEI